MSLTIEVQFLNEDHERFALRLVDDRFRIVQLVSSSVVPSPPEPLYLMEGHLNGCELMVETFIRDNQALTQVLILAQAQLDELVLAGLRWPGVTRSVFNETAKRVAILDSVIGDSIKELFAIGRRLEQVRRG